MINLISQHFKKTTCPRVVLANVSNFFEDVAELFVQEENLLLKQLVLAGGWHLAHPGQENINITGCARLNEVREH